MCPSPKSALDTGVGVTALLVLLLLVLVLVPGVVVVG
jgi:hypothetical protein